MERLDVFFCSGVLCIMGMFFLAIAQWPLDICREDICQGQQVRVVSSSLDELRVARWCAVVTNTYTHYTQHTYIHT